MDYGTYFIFELKIVAIFLHVFQIWDILHEKKSCQHP